MVLMMTMHAPMVVVMVVVRCDGDEYELVIDRDNKIHLGHSLRSQFCWRLLTGSHLSEGLHTSARLV